MSVAPWVVPCAASATPATFLVISRCPATENGASVYPVGVETVMPGMMPPPHATMFYEYTATVYANQTDGTNGSKLPIPDFKLRVFAVAVKFVHD